MHGFKVVDFQTSPNSSEGFIFLLKFVGDLLYYHVPVVRSTNGLVHGKLFLPIHREYSTRTSGVVLEANFNLHLTRLRTVWHCP